MDVFQEEITFQKMGQASQADIFLMLAVTSLAFLSEIVQKTGTENSETMQIKRNGYGKDKKKRRFLCRLKEKKQDIEIRVSPKIYSEKRLEKEFQKARKELAKVISGGK